MSLLEELQDGYGMEEATEENSSLDEFDYPVSCRTGWIGCGQGGSNIALMARLRGYASVLLINTSEADVDKTILPPDKEFHTLFIASKGKDGTAKNRVDAKKYALENSLEIRNAIEQAFQDDVERIVVCITLGGGTGSGAGPHVIEMAKEYIRKRGGNPKSDVIVKMAFPCPLLDGELSCYNALEAYKEIDRLGVATVPIDNAKLLEANKNVPLGKMWIGPNHWIVETFHQFNVYTAKESNLGRFDKQELTDILARGRFFYSMFRVPSLDNKYSISGQMGTHLKNTVFADMGCGTAEAAGCILAVNDEWAESVPRDYITSAFESINTIMKGHSTLHKGIYVETFKKGKKQKSPPAVYGYFIFGGLSEPTSILRKLYENTGEFYKGYSSYEAWRKD